MIKLHVLRSGEEDEWRYSGPSGVHEHQLKRPTLSSLCSPLMVCVCMRERICLWEIKGERFVCVRKRERKKEKEGKLEICSGDQELEKIKVKQTWG